MSETDQGTSCTPVFKKSALQLHFEVWAKEHKFRCSWDDEKLIYIWPLTQGAWMAFEEGVRHSGEPEQAVLEYPHQDASGKDGNSVAS